MQGLFFSSHEDRCIARVSIKSAAENYSWVCAEIARDCSTVGALCIWPVLISVKSFTANCTKVAICGSTLLTRSMSTRIHCIHGQYLAIFIAWRRFPSLLSPCSAATATAAAGTDSGIFDAWADRRVMWTNTIDCILRLVGTSSWRRYGTAVDTGISLHQSAADWLRTLRDRDFLSVLLGFYVLRSAVIILQVGPFPQCGWMWIWDGINRLRVTFLADPLVILLSYWGPLLVHNMCLVRPALLYLNVHVLKVFYEQMNYYYRASVLL